MRAPFARRHGVTVALATSLATAATSLPAAAIEAPPPPDEPVPGAGSVTYQLPANVEVVEGIEPTSSLQQGVAEMVEEFMFDFDEGCWEQYGEASGPTGMPGAVVWREAHTRWMGEYLLAEPLPDTPYATAFDAGDAENEEVIFASQGLAEHMDELVEMQEVSPAVAPPAMVFEPFSGSNYPVTGMMLDTRYWEEGAEESFVDCVFEAANAAALAFAQQTGMWVAVNTSLPDAETITGCFEDTEAQYGEVCLSEEDDPSLCTNLDWHESWCGRQAYLDYGQDPSWVCNAELDAAIDDYITSTGAAPEPLLLPETTYYQGQPVHHPGLTRVTGIRIPMSSDATYSESDRYTPDGTPDPADVLAAAQERQEWENNGLEVYSCAEYAYERYEDMSDLDVAAQSHQRSPRWIFDAAFYGRDGVGPYVTAAPTEADFREKDGDKVWLNHWYYPDDGFVPWTRADRFAPEEDKRRHRLFATYATAYDWDTRLSTFKNVYFYLHRLRKGPTGGFEGECDEWTRSLREHYTVNTAWHRLMDQTAAQAGFLDDEMEVMRTKQEELWALYLDFLASDDPSERESLTGHIDDALREGYEAGCIPLHPGTPTPCDWAPSLFADGMMEDLHYWRKQDFDECVEELGEGSFDNDELHDRFVDINNAAPGISSTWMNMINNARNAALQRDYTASADNLGTYFHDMLGIGNSWGYRDLILQALSAAGDTALVDTTEFEHTIGGEYFGASTRHRSTSQALSEPAEICVSAPAMNGLDTVDIKLGPLNKQVLEAIINLIDHGSTVAEDGPFQPAQGYNETVDQVNPWSFSASVYESHELVHAPEVGTTLSSGLHVTASFTAGYSYATPLASVGWAAVKLRLGASGGVTADAAVTASRTWHSLASTSYTPPSQAVLAANGGVDPCGEPHSSSTSFSVTPSASLTGSAALGVSLAYVLEAGIRGSLTVIRVSAPIRYVMSTTTNNPDRIGREDKELYADLVLDLMSGAISFYIALDAVITTIPIFELVLAKWTGLKITKPIKNKTIQNGDLCITTELAILGKTVAGWESDPCPCRLRPANCHG